MDFSLVVRVVWAFAVVGLLLLGLWYSIRMFGRGRMIQTAEKRLVSVIESTFLSQHTTLHVVKVGDRYYLVGGGNGQVSLMSEVPSDIVDAWIDTQRRSLATDRESLAAFVNRFRKRR